MINGYCQKKIDADQSSLGRLKGLCSQGIKKFASFQPSVNVTSCGDKLSKFLLQDIERQIQPYKSTEKDISLNGHTSYSAKTDRIA